MAINTFSGGNFINSLQAAGKNAVINGGMDIWQRGTSSTNMVAGYYTADRWKTVRSSNTAGYTVSQQATFQQGTAYAIRLQRTAANTSTDSMFLAYAIETKDWAIYQGKTLTFSFYAKGGANYSPTSGYLGVNLYTGTGTDQDPLAALTGEVQQVGQNAVITTTATRYSYTFTVPSNSTDMRLNFSIAPTGTAGAADYVDITGVQIELGSTATTFSRAGGTIQGELAACQRYYYRNTGGAAYSYYTFGRARSATIFYAIFNLPVTMRIAPTSIDFSSLIIADPGVGQQTVTTAAFDYSSPNTPAIIFNAASGLTSGQSYFILNNNNTAGYIGVSAEL
jgi:hypothetical protein